MGLLENTLIILLLIAISAFCSTSEIALAAARALMEVDGLSAEDIARRAMKIAADICVYTNNELTLESL